MMFWSTELKTAGTVASGSSGKFFRASTIAMPPFCIPTSIDTVRAVSAGYRNTRATT